MDDLETMTKDELYWEYGCAKIDVRYSVPTPEQIARQTAAEDELTRRGLPLHQDGARGHLHDPDRERDMEGEEAWALRVAGEEDQDSGEWGA